jgi:hypothetical protein
LIAAFAATHTIAAFAASVKTGPRAQSRARPLFLPLSPVS